MLSAHSLQHQSQPGQGPPFPQLPMQLLLPPPSMTYASEWSKQQQQQLRYGEEKHAR